ncbi:MAG: aminotransferase class III-fold pyridoxal phosphate-dependent enzyme [Desulfobacterales bacterium]|jgi:taurine--2-oxoglutarate transaminase
MPTAYESFDQKGVEMLDKETIKELDRRHVVHSWSVQEKLDPLVVDKSEGMYFWDADGNKYLDFSSSLVNMNVGHQHPKVVEGIKEQAEKLCYIHPGIACTARVVLARDLAELTPGDLNKFFFTLGGADANENALKFARAYTGKAKVLTKYRSYHGATYGAISMSGDPRRLPVEPGIPGVRFFLDPYCYRCSFGLEYPSCNLRCVNHIEEIIGYEGAQNVAAVFIEPFTGAGGFFAPPNGYFQRLREICDKHDVLMITDEVMAGCGRTGKWFAIEHFKGVVPDMMTLAKGLTCGYVPIGAVAISDRIMDKLGKEMLYAGLTFNSHPLACATAKSVLDVYKEDNLIEASAENGEYLKPRLQDLMERHVCVGDVRGAGSFFCLELVQDRGTKEMLKSEISATLVKRLMSKGLSTNVMANRLFIGPPFIATREDLDKGLAIIDGVLTEVDQQL